MPAIEAVGLTKKFGALTAVDSVTFEVEEGEVFGFLGPNGAGKTTTVRKMNERVTADVLSVLAAAGRLEL
jgi:ABC-2 type transport system ATP-binding protein